MCVYLQRRQGPNMSPCTTGPLDHLYVALDSQCNHHPSYLSMSMEMSMEMWLLKRVEAGRTRGKRGKGLTIQPVSCDCGVRETGIANHASTSIMCVFSFFFFFFPFHSFFTINLESAIQNAVDRIMSMPVRAVLVPILARLTRVDTTLPPSL